MRTGCQQLCVRHLLLAAMRMASKSLQANESIKSLPGGGVEGGGGRGGGGKGEGGKGAKGEKGEGGKGKCGRGGGRGRREGGGRRGGTREIQQTRESCRAHVGVLCVWFMLFLSLGREVDGPHDEVCHVCLSCNKNT